MLYIYFIVVYITVWRGLLFIIQSWAVESLNKIIAIVPTLYLYIIAYQRGQVGIYYIYMKTYLLDILNKYNRFSENLDVKTILCNKSWWIFNDSGNKELYIFQDDSSLIASVNGNVNNGTWQYIPANKSLIISFKEQSYMLHPSFIDNVVFALQQDGTERFLFMINEEQFNSFQLKSLNDLKSYFKKKEQVEKLKEIQHEQAIRADRQRIQEENKLKHYKEQWITCRSQLWEQQRCNILNSSLEYQTALKNRKKWRIIKFIIFLLFLSYWGWYIFYGIDYINQFKKFSWWALFIATTFTLSFPAFIVLCLITPYETPTQCEEELKQNFINK